MATPTTTELIEVPRIEAIRNIVSLCELFRNQLLELLHGADQPPSHEELQQKLNYLRRLEEILRDKEPLIKSEF